MARLLLVLALVLLAGCQRDEDVTRTEDGVLQLGRAAASDTTERVVHLGGRTLVLTAGAGAITVVGTDAEEARLRFTRMARGASESSAAERLQRFALEEAGDEARYQYVVRSEAAEGARVSVEALVPHDTPLVVRLDRGAVRLSGLTGTVEVENQNGEVELAGTASGRVRLTTRRGAVRAGFSVVEPAADVRLRTENGDVALTLPTATNAEVRVATGAGDIAVQGLQFQNRNLDESATGMRFTGRLGRGRARIQAETEVGNVALREGSVYELEGVSVFQEVPADTAAAPAARPGPDTTGAGAEAAETP